MKQIIKTAGQIMEEVRMLTGWNFAGAMKGDICILSACLVNEEGKKIEVSMEIVKTDVQIKVSAASDRFDLQAIERVTGKLDFPFETEVREGESFQITHHEPLGVLEHSVKGVVKQCIVPMTDAVAEVLAVS